MNEEMEKCPFCPRMYPKEKDIRPEDRKMKHHIDANHWKKARGRVL